MSVPATIPVPRYLISWGYDGPLAANIIGYNQEFNVPAEFPTDPLRFIAEWNNFGYTFADRGEI